MLYYKKEVVTLKITVVQPAYYAGETPDEKTRQFLLQALENVREDSLTVLPEYSNAGGLSDAERERQAMPHARARLEKAARIAGDRSASIAINVLEEREGKIRNRTDLFGKDGQPAFVYDKIHLPPSELALGVQRGDGACVCDLDGIRFGFMTCYDVYFNEQIEFLAKHKPDVILVPGYQRGERADIIRAQAKLLAFRCNAFVARASFSMDDDSRGGCSMIVSPEGKILEDMGKAVGSISAESKPQWKFMRTAGFGGDMVANDDFINAGLCPEIFQK